MTVKKGDIIPLMITQTGRDRVLIAISWDERQDKPGLIQRITKSYSHHDLDLSCFIYNHTGEFIDFVGSMAQDAMDESGAIYHSGDEDTGERLGDDEYISCELGGLPLSTTDLIFVTEIRSGQLFDHIADPRARIADGMTDTDLLRLPMDAPESVDKSAHIIARIFRDRGSPTGWSLHVIDEYPPLSEVSDWGSYLGRYL